MNQTITTNSFEETQKIGEEFVKRLNLSQGSTLAKRDLAIVIALYGDLGSGKTTFVQGLAKGLRIQRRIISPTFIIMRSYEVNSLNVPSPFQGEGKVFDGKRSRIGEGKYANKNLLKSFYHIDLYRTENAKDIEGLGVKELMKNPENIAAIEWSEKMGSALPKERIELKFEYLTEFQRKITICQNL